MLTVEHVRVSRRKNGLVVIPRCGLDEQRSSSLLQALLAVAREHHGRTKGELVEALAEVMLDIDDLDERRRASLERARRAAQKLVLDRCGFAVRDDLDPPQLRREVFTAAAQARMASTDGGIDREQVLHDMGAARGLDVTALDQALWADLDDAHLVDATGLFNLKEASLLTAWHQAELAALLLRARRLVIDVDATPAQLRRLRGSLKLHQLLFSVEQSSQLSDTRAGLSLIIEGPMALFSSSVRYGLKLSMLLPHILACRRHRLVADVSLSRGRGTEPFVVAGASDDVDEDLAVGLSPLVSALQQELSSCVQRDLPGSRVSLAADIVSLPSGGGFVPDLVVEWGSARAYVEVLGFWSREAVWRRVEWVERGLLPVPTIFCVSERLRVSEQALPEDSPQGALVVFKGALSAKKVSAALAKRLVAGACDPSGTRP